MSEPTFTVPLSVLVKIGLSDDTTWWWGCHNCERGAWFIPSRPEAQAAAVEHLSTVHGLVRVWEGRELRAGDTTEIHYEGSRRSATVWHLGNSSGPLIIVPDEDGATNG